MALVPPLYRRLGRTPMATVVPTLGRISRHLAPIQR